MTHNTAGQMRAVVNGTTAEMQTLGAVSGNTTMIQPLASTSSTQTQQTATQMRPNAVATPKKATGFTYNVSHGQPASSSAASNNIASSAQPKATPNPGGKPSGVSTGTAAPPNCVYLSPSQPCVPLAQYQQMQAQQPTRVAVETCPPSGFVPGLMRRTSSDTSEGVPCTPGQPINPSLFASSGTSGSGSASGSGTSSGGDQVIGKSSCITSRFGDNPEYPGYHSGDFLILSNLCAEGLRVTWYMGKQMGATHTMASFATYISPATRQPGADNRVSTYVCPLDHPIATQASGVEVTGRDQPYHCEKTPF